MAVSRSSGSSGSSSVRSHSVGYFDPQSPIVVIFLPLRRPPSGRCSRPRAKVEPWLAFWPRSLVFLLASDCCWRFDPAARSFQLELRRALVQSAGDQLPRGRGRRGAAPVLLTTFLMPMVVLASWRSRRARQKEFRLALLVLRDGDARRVRRAGPGALLRLLGAMLIPMYLLIGVWGGERPASTPR